MTCHSLGSKYILAVDIGTSSIRCHVYDLIDIRLIATTSNKVEVLTPQPGWFELDPESIWEGFCGVIREAISDAQLKPSEIACLGISTQRNTFTIWSRANGSALIPFILWNDLRSTEIVKRWNRSFFTRALRAGSSIALLVTRSGRYRATSALSFKTASVPARLIHVFESQPELRQACISGRALYGCIESFLLWRLTATADPSAPERSHGVHATDYSCASATQLFDPFVMQWSVVIAKLYGVPKQIVPECRDTASVFGKVRADLFGASFPVTCLVADQQAAVFASGCVRPGDLKLTLGTGAFLDLNTGSHAHGSQKNIYPLVGWKIGPLVTFLAEGHIFDAGNALDWANRIGLFDSFDELDSLLQSVSVGSGGCTYVSAFGGLQPPFADPRAASLLIGLQPTSSRGQLARAIVEGLVFNVRALASLMAHETRLQCHTLRTNGGVARSDTVMQMLADVCEQRVERNESVEMSVLGAAMLAKLGLELDGLKLNEAQLRARVEHVAQLARRVRGDLTLFEPRTLSLSSASPSASTAALEAHSASPSAVRESASDGHEVHAHSEQMADGEQRSRGAEAAGQRAADADADELRTRYGEAYARWLRAVDRSRSWHQPSSASSSARATRSTSRSSSVLAAAVAAPYHKPHAE